MKEKYEYRSTVSTTFVQDCGYMKQEKSDLTRAHWRDTPTRASAFKCPVIFNFEIYFQDFQMKKIGCDKCLQRENLHLRYLSFLGNFGQRYLWIDKSNGGLSCWPPRLIFSLCQQLLNYRKIEDDFACTVSVIYFTFTLRARSIYWVHINLLRWSFFTFIYNRSSEMNYFIYFTSFHSSREIWTQ